MSHAMQPATTQGKTTKRAGRANNLEMTRHAITHVMDRWRHASDGSEVDTLLAQTHRESDRHKDIDRSAAKTFGYGDARALTHIPSVIGHKTRAISRNLCCHKK